MMRLERPKPLVGRPRVSVVIPCYNYGHFLPAAVRSATAVQPGVDVDVLIVDDASSDGSGDVARELAAADHRVKLLQHEVNLGHLQTYNDGLDAVDGDYVVLLSADDLLAPQSLARACALLESHPAVGFVYGFAKSFQNHPPAGRTRIRSWGVWSGAEWASSVCRRGGTTVVNPEVVMRRDVLRQLGGYDLHLPQTADMDMWLRAAKIADVGRINGPYQAFYRVHGANMHLNEFAGILTDVRARAATINHLYGASDDPGNRRLRALADRAIAVEALDLAAAGYDQGRTEQVPVAEFQELAATVWPPVTKSLRWRLIHRRRKATAPRPWMVAADRARTLRLKIRWRRWARYGV